MRNEIVVLLERGVELARVGKCTGERVAQRSVAWHTFE
jgi:hypothetical protein